MGYHCKLSSSVADVWFGLGLYSLGFRHERGCSDKALAEISSLEFLAREWQLGR